MSKRHNPTKIWILKSNDGWVCDTMAADWYEFNPKNSTNNISEANVVWLLASENWKSVDWDVVKPSSRIVTTIHHIVPEKFKITDAVDFKQRDELTTTYLVFNQRTFETVRTLTKKPINMLHYWANGFRWKQTGTKEALRTQYSLSQDAYIIGSFHRDTGIDRVTPLYEKGPDIFIDYIKACCEKQKHVHVLLAGDRRQYIVSELEKNSISYTLIKEPTQIQLNDLYQTLDLYVVSSRYEGGPQSFIECGLLNVPVVSRRVGIAEQVLPQTAINNDITSAVPAVPNVDSWKLPMGIKPFKRFLTEV